MKDKEDEIWEDVVMKTNIHVLREKGYIVFEKEDQVWMYISSRADLIAWGKLNGFDSITELEDKSWFSIDEIIGKTICFYNNWVEFAQDREWWNAIDLKRVDAVLNSKQFGWALDGKFLDHMGALEFGMEIIRRFRAVCGKDVSLMLSSEFMNHEWSPESDTAGFLEGIVDFLSDEFNFDLGLAFDGDEIQYFSGAWVEHKLQG